TWEECCKNPGCRNNHVDRCRGQV
uniref:Alpha-conotoxin-like RgIB n=1 Tax=Conus regius TaxID=101314 RepID=CA1LB_CONRE|nr:RecName: Full=Alpha-conotoxin-like RgIB; Short=Alpha-RGIB [Conus regius]